MYFYNIILMISGSTTPIRKEEETKIKSRFDNLKKF